MYSSYISTLSNKDLNRYFAALRELSQIYLIESAASHSVSVNSSAPGNKGESAGGFFLMKKISTGSVSKGSTVSSLYNNAREIATIIADVNRYDGIFQVEEVFEFASRRADWFVVKAEVERGLYGYGCTLL